MYSQKFVAYFFIVSAVFCSPLNAESFNTGELIIKSGSKHELADDEGYLFLAFETDTKISRLTIGRKGVGNKIRFNGVERGENHALLKVKAGQYHWKHINIFFGRGVIRKTFKNDDFTFTVKPGVVNYPGSWSFTGRWVGNMQARMHLAGYNHLSYEFELFKAQYQKLVGQVSFEYQGTVKDPYPGHLNQAVKAYDREEPMPELFYSTANKDQLPFTIWTKDTPTTEADQRYPSLRKYFQFDRQAIRSTSPNQSLMLFSAKNDDVISIGIIGVEKFDTYLLYQQKLPSKTTVSELSWIDDDSFFLTLSNQDQDRSYVAHLNFDEAKNTINAQFIKFRKKGYLLSSLPKQPNQLFFVVDPETMTRQKNGLYLVDVSSEKSIDQSFKKIHKNTKKLKDVIDWLVDAQGRVRAAITYSYDKKTEDSILDYWFLADANTNDWQKINTIRGSDDVFWLSGLSADESHFLVITNAFSDKYAIHKYSTSDGSHLGDYYANPEHDINRVLYANGGSEVAGYTYHENGLLQVHYFKELDQEFSLAQINNPDLQLFVVQPLTRFNRMLLFGFSPDTQGSWFMLNTDSGQADKIFDYSPSYVQLAKGKHHALETKASDGVDLEGYLVMPDQNSAHKPPLIVMPHGGPIGVQDFAYESEMQHFLASQGFATLKVNYRGSGGYGKAFEELGKQQWGEKIEQDIHTMTQYALKNHPIDGSKICVMGSSYGGYSALMLTHLYPETYLCAVSFAGVMDLPLIFTSRDLTNDPELLQGWKEIVGDPDTELDRLINKSPLYLLKDMQRPLLLFQGVEDSRVRVEHALRMQQLISLYGMDHEVVLLEDEGHGFSKDNTASLYLDKSLQFIKQHLTIQ